MRYLWLLVLLLLTSPLVADETDSDLILILDASNSMWGQIDGTNKIVIAREAVGGLIDGLPDDANVGLIAYGHRREGDCDDIEVLADVGPVDKDALKATINGINPKGRTPITASINAAIEIAAERDGSSIVLISDGLETCDLDPCAAVRTAREEGVPFILHVVGFDVSGEDTSQLECAAQAGGGLYLAADDAPQLSQALQSAYEKPVEPDGRLVVSATAEEGLQDALILVSDAGSGAHVAGGRTYTSSETNPRRIPLEDGSYRAEVKAVGIRGTPTYHFEFEIVDGNAVERDFDFSAGEISVRVTRNGELSDATVNARRSGERTNTAGGRTYTSESHNPKVMRVAAGTYDVIIRSVEVRNAPEQVVSDVVVIGGETTELEFAFDSGVLSVGTQRGDVLVDSVVNVVDSNGANAGGGRTYTSPDSNPKSIVVVPGEYTVRIREVRGEEREIAVSVAAGETTQVIVDLDQAAE